MHAGTVGLDSHPWPFHGEAATNRLKGFGQAKTGQCISSQQSIGLEHLGIPVCMRISDDL